MHTPTAEQAEVHHAAIDLLSTPRGIIKCVAGAGSGKTTTLIGAAAKCKEAGASRLIYIALSKPLVEISEKIFRHIGETRTFSSLAYEGTNAGAGNRRTGPIYPAQVIEAFGLDSKRLPTSPIAFAKIIIAIVTTFCNSSSAEISKQHLPLWVKDPVIAGLALKYAPVLFNGLCPGANTTLPLPHPLCLKAWSLRGCPGLSQYDYVLFDEAQDAAGVHLSCLAYAKRALYVGDVGQQIFTFKNAQDAMLKIPGKAYPLTLSFRFGQQIADAANSIIRAKASKVELRLKGLPSKQSTIGPVAKNEPHTRIYRTNAALLQGALTLSDLGSSINIVGDMSDLQSKLQGASNLLRGVNQDVRHPAYQQFRSWDEFEGWMSKNPENDISQIGNLVKNNARRVDTLVRICKHQSAQGSVSLVTAHRSKGCEYQNVIISGDFDDLLDPLLINNKSMSPQGDEELNTMYVALTRTQSRVESQSEVLNSILR